jgi:hypothetical protein
MLDARIFLDNLDRAKQTLQAHNALFKGEYSIHDIIYASKNPKETLDKVFLRLRLIPKNIWSEKNVVVTIKNTELHDVGKKSIILLKKEFDTKDEAEKFVQDHYGHQFDYSYEFDRIGWQYDLGEDQVDLEDIEGNFSIEFKSPTEEGLKKILALFTVEDKEVIKGPSVVAIRELLEGN